MFESIEKQAARIVLKALDDAGIPHSIDYENGYEPSGVTSNDYMPKRMEELFACDEGWIMTGTAYEEGPFDGFIWFIWGNGNGGRDCIADYSTNLERILGPIMNALESC